MLNRPDYDIIAEIAHDLRRDAARALKRRQPHIPPPVDCVIYAEQCLERAEELEEQIYGVTHSAIEA